MDIKPLNMLVVGRRDGGRALRAATPLNQRVSIDCAALITVVVSVLVILLEIKHDWWNTKSVQLK